MPGPQDFINSMQQAVQAINNLTQQVKSTFPQASAVSTAAVTAGTITFTSSQASAFLSVTTSSGATYHVPLYPKGSIMVSTFTTNRGLEQPARGDDVGTWDTPVNGNMSIVDNSFGGTAVVALLGSNVVLSSGQYQNYNIVLTGALTASVSVTLPVVGATYAVFNATTNTSAFTVTMKTTLGSGTAIGIPPVGGNSGGPVMIYTNQTFAGIGFLNLPWAGSLWDFGGSSVPAWVAACSVPPWLNCDGTVFSSATYPILATILGGTTLPDLRGSYRANLNQGTGRLTTGLGTGGVDGNTNLARGGAQAVSVTQANLPNVSFPVTDPTHAHVLPGIVGQGTITGTLSAGQQAPFLEGNMGNTTNAAATGITVNSGGSGIGLAVLPPTAVVGITMIRAG